MVSVAKCGKMWQNITKCGAICAHLEQISQNVKDLWPFCENLVCPDPVWKSVKHPPAPNAKDFGHIQSFPKRPKYNKSTLTPLNRLPLFLSFLAACASRAWLAGLSAFGFWLQEPWRDPNSERDSAQKRLWGATTGAARHSLLLRVRDLRRALCGQIVTHAPPQDETRGLLDCRSFPASCSFETKCLDRRKWQI